MNTQLILGKDGELYSVYREPAPELWLRNTGQVYLIYGNEIIASLHGFGIPHDRWEQLALTHPKLSHSVTVEAVRIA